MTSRVTYTFTPDQVGPQTHGSGQGSAMGTLAGHLQELLWDTGTPAAELARQMSERAQEWVFSQSPDWGHGEAAATLEEALCALEEAHGWRGVIATWLDQVRGTAAFALGRKEGGGPRSAIAEEMGLWLEADGSLRAQGETGASPRNEQVLKAG